MIDVTSPSVATVELDAAADTASFTNYLRRLGCTVGTTSNGQTRAFITYPETVEEEEQALWAWCDHWARRHAVAIQLSFEPAA
jgi:hypothetical protein